MSKEDASFMGPRHLVWLDLEMTGLEPAKERIIEIATVITNSDLEVIARGPNVVIHQSPRILKAMDDWNQKQHTKSGLVELVKESKISPKKAEEMTLEFLKGYCLPKSSPLCGSSVHHDRRFLVKYMPKLHDFFHYRNIDVSTVKALVARWYPKNRAAGKKADAHRALPDILESIDELKYMRETYFK